MKFSEWVVAERGRLKCVAQFFDITPSAVSQWITNGVPVDRMSEVRELTGGAVSLDEMIAGRKSSERQAA